MMQLLHAGDRFPSIAVSVRGGATVRVPEVFAGGYGAVLFFRGAACRVCVEQLRAFERASRRFEKAGAGVIALSADDEETTAALVAEYGLGYPVGHSADVDEIAAATGAFATIEPPQLQSTGFVIGPTGEVVVSVYSCGAVGQLLPDDVLELIRDEREAAASGERADAS
jgi:peroxiredoxin